jgi:glycosyltransferase involved in cell wall biosynthesis
MTKTCSLAPTYWVDVEDFFQYFAANPRPSGIQRLVFEVLSALPERASMCPDRPRIAFVRHAQDASLLQEVPFASLVQMLEASTSSVARPLQRSDSRSRQRTKTRLRHAAIRLFERLPPTIGEPLLRAGVLQLAALRHARLLARMLSRPAASRSKIPRPASDSPSNTRAFPGLPGDVFLILGAAWVHSNYGLLLQELRTRYRLVPILLMYDLIPLRRPEWCAAELVHNFSAWLTATLPHCGKLLAISHATAADVEAYAREISLPLAGPVTPIPIGTGFKSMAAEAPDPLPRGLPRLGSYVLFVSTLEARKNHALLFRVWRRLLAELPREQVPTLVFAGRVGWLVADLMQQLENTSWLDGKIRLIRDPTDAELAALYRGCQFTLFPSLFEGWGLPVSESLAHGRPCLSSNATSLPESGGDLARYFDPENVDDACRAVRAIIEDPNDLKAWRDRVAREFRHVPWERTADAILAACRAEPPALSATAVLEPAT